MHKIIAWFLSFFNPPNVPRIETLAERIERIGRENEQRALALCTKLYDTDRLPMATGRPFLSKTGSNEDLDGLDLLLPTDCGPVGIQIKSSVKGIEEFISFHKLGKRIPAISVNPGKSDAWVQLDLESAFAVAYKRRKSLQ